MRLTDADLLACRRRRGRCEPVYYFPAMLAVSYNICVTDRNMQELIE